MKYSSPIAYISGLILFVFAIREILTAFFMAPGLSSGMMPIGILVFLHLLAGGLFLATSYRQIFRPRLVLLVLAMIIFVFAAFGDVWAFYDVLSEGTPVERESRVDTIIDTAIKESFNEPIRTIKRTLLSTATSLAVLAIPLYSNLSRVRLNKN